MQIGKVQTVCGDIAPDELGVTLMHEHLRPPVKYIWPWVSGPDNRRSQDDLAWLIDVVRPYVACGGRTMAEVSSHHRQIDNRAEQLVALSEATGMHIVMGTAFYKEPMYPEWVQKWGIEDFQAFFLKNVTEGIGNTSIKAGIIGEIGTFRGRVNPREEMVLRAAARVHRQTGVPISTHCTLGTMPMAQIDILEDEGMSLSRVVLGHQDLRSDVDVHEAAIKRGAYIQYDTIGKERYDYVIQENRGLGEVEYLSERHYRKDADRLACLVELVKRGCAGHIMLSQDMSVTESFFNPDTHGRFGYTYLLDCFVPHLREAGVSEADINTMLVENPKRFLAFGQ